MNSHPGTHSVSDDAVSPNLPGDRQTELKNLKTNIALFENFVETGIKLSRVLKSGKAGKNGQIWVSVTSAGYSRGPVYNGNDLFGSR